MSYSYSRRPILQLNLSQPKMRSTPDYIILMWSRSLNFLSLGLYPVTPRSIFLQFQPSLYSELLLLSSDDELDDYFLFLGGLSFQTGRYLGASFLVFSGIQGLGGAGLSSLGLSFFSFSLSYIFSRLASTLLLGSSGFALTVYLFQIVCLGLADLSSFFAKISTTVGMYLASFLYATLSTGLGVLVFAELDEDGLFGTGCILLEQCYFCLGREGTDLFLLMEEMQLLISSSFLFFLISGSFFFGAGKSISNSELSISELDSFFSAWGGGGWLKS